MTERERIRDDEEVRGAVRSSDVAAQSVRASTTPVVGEPLYSRDVVATVPVDRIRWGPVIGGLFVALSTLALLSVLGLAIGFTAYSPNAPAQNFGIGAGIWGAISALIAFGIGGWFAARTAAVRGRSNGMLNGVMVWAVAIPLMLYFLGSGITGLASTAGTVANTAAQIAGGGVNNPGLQATVTVPGAPVTPGQVENAAGIASQAAWGTFISLLLGLAAAAIGGLLGAREPIVASTVRT